MTYTIKGLNGIGNFVSKYAAEEFNKMQIHDSYLIKRLFDDEFIIKDGIPALQDGDTITAEFTDEGYYTKQSFTIVKTFVVVKHDSFLLKLVKQ